MTGQQNTQRLWLAFAGVLVITIVTVAADRMQLLSGVRIVLHDGLSPGRLLVAAVSPPAGSQEPPATDGQRLAPLQAQLREVEQERRQLLIENAQLRNRLRRLDVSSGYSERSVPLTGFELVSAQVLSHCGMPAGLRQAMVDAGRAHGLTRSELVLDADGVLLDIGSQDGVEAGHSVLAGAVVLGRVVRAGHWVSQLLPVTDPAFTARIRLVRPTGHSGRTTVEGMLEGTGDACRIVGVTDTASVAVGDEVFSADINGIAGPRVYYGTVTAATFESAGEWAITVRPAGQLADVDQVAIVVPHLDSQRVATDSSDSGGQGGS